MSSETQTTALTISILHEDADLLVVDKPAGLVVHPAYKHPDGTLFDMVNAHLQERGETRPCLLHRLDKETSGAVMLAKTERARRHLVRQFEQRTIRKTYLALVCGWLAPPDGRIDAPLCRDPADRRRMHVNPLGDHAQTAYQTLKVCSDGRFSLVELHPITGRMHQLRVHLAALNTPIVGDSLYAAPDRWTPLAPARLCLHAWQILFQHPATGEWVSVAAPLPDDMQSILASGIPTEEASSDRQIVQAQPDYHLHDWHTSGLAQERTTIPRTYEHTEKGYDFGNYQP